MILKISLFQLILTFALIFSCLTIATQSTDAPDYCSKSLCMSDHKHIACGNNGKINSTCAEHSKIIELTPEIRNHIVKKHNEYRNKLALGKVPKFRSATRMGTMRWHNELAKMAAYNVKTCTAEHDACHNTHEFKHSGQNIAKKTSQNAIHFDEATKFMYHEIDEWFSEHKICPEDTSIMYNKHMRKCGHFTVMIADRNVYVGCAAILINAKKIVFTCNYAWNNIYERMIYIPGPTALDCHAGHNEEYAGLCSAKEKYYFT